MEPHNDGKRPQGLDLLSFFNPAPCRSPEASGPLVVWTSVQEISYPPVFLKRKPADHPGCLWGHPLSVSLLRSERPVPNEFSTRRKGVAAHSISPSAGFRAVCADRLKRVLSPLIPRGIPFLDVKKGGKEMPRGSPLEPQVILSIFSL